jgi:3-deoxy-7-phosphoheptulonate synthase
MVVVMNVGADEAQIEAVIDKLNSLGFDVHRSTGVNRSVLGAVGVKPEFDTRRVAVLDGVSEVFRVTEPYKFASRSWVEMDTEITVGDVTIGGNEVVVMAGPCSVEDEDQIHKTAEFVAAQGATILRGGAFKPRSSPYSFQGLGSAGLKMLRDAADAHGLHVITELMEVGHLDEVVSVADIVQVGARNMQNFPLLKELGKVDRPVFLKRGLSATVEEWIMSAEYVMAHGNPYVILCERGIRTFEPSTRNTLDLSAVPVVKSKSHLPVFVDPSHGVGIRNKVVPLARAAVAVGADGLMIEVHPNPDGALSDGPQSLEFDQFVDLMKQIRLIAGVLGRTVAPERISA